MDLLAGYASGSDEDANSDGSAPAAAPPVKLQQVASAPSITDARALPAVNGSGRADAGGLPADFFDNHVANLSSVPPRPGPAAPKPSGIINLPSDFFSGSGMHAAPGDHDTEQGLGPEAGPARPAGMHAGARMSELQDLPQPTDAALWAQLPAPKAAAAAGSGSGKRRVVFRTPLQEALLRAAAADSDDDDDGAPAAKRAKPSASGAAGGAAASVLSFLPPPKHAPRRGAGQAGGGGGGGFERGVSGSSGGRGGAAAAAAAPAASALTNEAFRVAPRPTAAAPAPVGSSDDDEDELGAAGVSAGARAAGLASPGAGDDGGADGWPPASSGQQQAAQQQAQQHAAQQYRVQPASVAGGGGGRNGASLEERLLSQALQEEAARAARRGGAAGAAALMQDIQFKEVNASQLKYVDPAKREANEGMRSALGSDYAAQLRAAAAPFEGGKLAKRKHQIGTLFANAKLKELEVLEGRAAGMKTKSETQGKYGW